MIAALALAGCKPQSDSVGASQSRTANEIDLRAQAAQILNEPEYGGTPHYALLVFGEKADTQTWLVVDNTTVYLDRNGDGDLTTTGEKIHLDEKATAKIEVGGTGEFKGMNVFDLGNVSGHNFELQVWVRNENYQPRSRRDIERVKQRRENGWMNATLWRTFDGGDGRAQLPLTLCPKPEDSQISHIGGMLTYNLKSGERQKLERSVECIFDIRIGTPGLATRNSQYAVFSNLTTKEVPEHIAPSAVFTFANKSEGADPIVMTVDLDLRC